MSLLRLSRIPLSARLFATCVALFVATLPGCGNAPDADNAPEDSHAETTTDSETAASPETTEAAPNEPTPASSTNAPTDESPATNTIAATEPVNEPAQTSATTAGPETQGSPADSAASEAAAAEQLERELARLKVPPAWLADVTSQWDMNKPWKDVRLEIRRLLGKGDDASRREGVKLMWD